MNARIEQEITLCRGLDAFGDHLDAHLVAQADQMLDDGLAGRVLVDLPDQIHIDLDQVRLEIRQQLQPRIAGPEIVDGGLEAAALVLAKNLRKPGSILDTLAFRG